MDSTFDLKKLRSEVEASGLKVKHIAEKIGVTSHTLNMFLNGKRALGASAQILLFQVLKLDIEAFKTKAS